jgi:tetratricopeptide (TPR) repeat protein
MPNSRSSSVSKRIVISSLVLLCCGLIFPAMAQLTFDPRIAPPPPKVNRTSRAANKRSPEEDTVEAGDKAREGADFETAFNSYTKVITGSRRNEVRARAFYGLGNVYAELACNNNAIKAYNDALKLKKDFREAIVSLGNEYVSKERFDEAEAQFRSLNAKDASRNIGLAFVLGKRKHYQEAITKLNLITSNSSINDSDRANAHLVLGDLYMEQGKYPEAANEFNKVIKLKHYVANAYIKLGQTELFPASSQFSSLVQQEIRIEDREKLINAAKYAADNIRKAISEHNYKHPFGDVFMSSALMSQFYYQEAERTLQTYMSKIDELKKRLPVLATNCDYGFNQLYAYGYLNLTLMYHQQNARETDPQKKGDFQDKVIQNAKKLIEVKGNHSEAYALIGTVYLAKGKYPEAIGYLDKAISYETNLTNKALEYDLIATGYSRMGRYNDAIDTLEKARKIQPDMLSLLGSLAGIYEKQGDLDQAIRLREEGMSREPTASSYWMLASTYFARGRSKNTDSDFERSIQLLEKAIEKNRTFHPAYFLLGQVYKFYKRGAHADKAIENYEMAAKYNPKDPFILLHLGDLYYTVKKNYDAAIKYLGDAIKLDPNLAPAYWELGAVYRDKGDDEQAIKYFREALRSDSSHQDAYFGLISIYRSRRNYAEVIKLLQDVFAVAPKEVWPYKEMAKAYEAQQKNDDAIKYYEQAIGLLKADDTFGKELYACRIIRLRRNYPEAIRCFQTLKPPPEEDPGQQAYDIGLTYVASGNKASALEQYEQLKKIGSALTAELMGQINEIK